MAKAPPWDWLQAQAGNASLFFLTGWSWERAGAVNRFRVQSNRARATTNERLTGWFMNAPPGVSASRTSRKGGVLLEHRTYSTYGGDARLFLPVFGAPGCWEFLHNAAWVPTTYLVFLFVDITKAGSNRVVSPVLVCAGIPGGRCCS
jgi:hypothetical protein